MAEVRRVLLAEDDRFLRRAAEIALRKHGYEVLLATDGEQALQLTRAERPDLVLLDVIMPKLQGFEVLARLKADPATSQVPVIMLSALSQESDVTEALEAGASAYIVKSNVRLDDLVAKITDVLSGTGR